MKFIVNSSGLETNFIELKDPLAFLDSIKKREMLIEEARHKQLLKNLIDIHKKKEHRLILISFLTEETMLLSLQMTMVQ